MQGRGSAGAMWRERGEDVAVGEAALAIAGVDDGEAVCVTNARHGRTHDRCNTDTPQPLPAPPLLRRREILGRRLAASW